MNGTSLVVVCLCLYCISAELITFNAISPRRNALYSRIDQANNNNLLLGTANQPYLQDVPSNYGTNFTPLGEVEGLPNPRYISLILQQGTESADQLNQRPGKANYE